MKHPSAEVFVICSKSLKKFNPLATEILKTEGLGFSHYSVGIRYKSEFIICEAIWPRPKFTKWEDWQKLHEPVFIFRKEVLNHFLLFEMTNWLSILCTKSWYSLTQLILIYLGRRIPMLKKWTTTVKLNLDSGLICSELTIRFLNQFFPKDFAIEKSEDSIGLKEPFDQLTARWVLLDSSTVAVLRSIKG